MKRRFLALVLAGCLAAVLSTAAWGGGTPPRLYPPQGISAARGGPAGTTKTR